MNDEVQRRFNRAVAARDNIVNTAKNRYKEQTKVYKEVKDWLYANGPDYISTDLWDDMYADMTADMKDKFDEELKRADIVYNKIVQEAFSDEA